MKEIKEFFMEVRNFLVGVTMEGSKGKGIVGTLFIWPFVIVLIIVVYLIIRIFIH